MDFGYIEDDTKGVKSAEQPKIKQNELASSELNESVSLPNRTHFNVKLNLLDGKYGFFKMTSLKTS